MRVNSYKPWVRGASLIGVGLALCLPMRAQSQSAPTTENSCRQFAQEFYDWYVSNSTTRAERRNGMSALEFALKNRRSSFEPSLARELEHVLAEEKRTKEPILDSDPILNSQDPDQRYRVGPVTDKEGKCRAEVYGVTGGKKRDRPDVVAELVLQDHQWRFADFDYPNAESPESKSLTALLRFLRKQRQK
jgi:hypothetical protein